MHYPALPATGRASPLPTGKAVLNAFTASTNTNNRAADLASPSFLQIGELHQAQLNLADATKLSLEVTVRLSSASLVGKNRSGRHSKSDATVHGSKQTKPIIDSALLQPVKSLGASLSPHYFLAVYSKMVKFRMRIFLFHLRRTPPPGFS